MASEHQYIESGPVTNEYMDYDPRITEASPVQDFGPGYMDYERLAPRWPPKPRTWWEVNSPSEETASRLAVPLIEFLKRAYDTEILGDNAELFYFLGGLMRADYLVLEGYFDGWKDRFLKIYSSSNFRCGDDEGVLFDNHTLKATFVTDYNDTYPVCRHEWAWMPLEVILDAYLQMIDEGKVESVSAYQSDQIAYYANKVRLMEPWIIHPYTKTDIARTVAAFKRLIDAIDSRIENKGETTYMNLPWHDSVTLTQDFIPPSSFAHAVLSAISHWEVRFRYIAPGIRFPTVSEFLDQVVTVFVNSRYNHLRQFPGNCPLRIFQIDAEERVHMMVLYQAGFINGFTEHHFVQIDKVLENWPERVETGDWEVTEDGVAGGIEKCREADTEENWRKYWTPPSW